MAGLAPEAMDEAALIALAQRLVRFPSPQTDRMEAEPAVQGFIGDCVAPLLAGLGLAGRRDRMGNLVVELGAGQTGRSLILMTYAMTHPAAAMKAPFGGELVDTPQGPAIRGRGISEQKGALAAAIAAVDAVARTGALRGRLVLALSSAGETGRHDAAISILESLGYTPDLGIIALGTDSKVALGNKGRIDVEITVHGKAAHSSTPWAGIDAIEGARRVLERLSRLHVGGEAHAQLGEATLTPTSIETWPKATHTIQSEARLTFDRRLLPGQDPDAAFSAIAAAVSEIGGPWRIEARRGAFMYPSEVAADGPLFTAIARSRKEAGLPPPEVLYSHAALDAGFLVARGAEAVMWGPGRMAQFHSEEECLLVAELVAGARDYANLLRSLLS